MRAPAPRVGFHTKRFAKTPTAIRARPARANAIGLVCLAAFWPTGFGCAPATAGRPVRLAAWANTAWAAASRPRQKTWRCAPNPPSVLRAGDQPRWRLPKGRGDLPKMVSICQSSSGGGLNVCMTRRSGSFKSPLASSVMSHSFKPGRELIFWGSSTGLLSWFDSVGLSIGSSPD